MSVISAWIFTASALLLEKALVVPLNRYSRVAWKCLVGTVTLAVIVLTLGYKSFLKSEYVVEPVYTSVWHRLKDMENFTWYINTQLYGDNYGHYDGAGPLGWEAWMRKCAHEIRLHGSLENREYADCSNVYQHESGGGISAFCPTIRSHLPD